MIFGRCNLESSTDTLFLNVKYSDSKKKQVVGHIQVENISFKLV